MLHACLYTICFVFCYTSWHFYAFFRTNILTRCHSASSLFLLFLCFKAAQEIFSELDETKAKIPIFPNRHGVQSRDGGVPGGGRTTPWRGPPPGRAGAWCGPLAHTLTLPFRLYIPLDGKTKEPRSISTKHTASRHRHRREIGRVQKLFPAPCRRGESPPEAFFITMPASGVMRE
jgi:hypothetical protein